MSGKGLVIQAGQVSRPDDGRSLYAIMTDAVDSHSLDHDALYIAPNDPDPPVSDDAVAWDKGWVIRLRDGRHYRMLGQTFNSNKRWG